MRRLSLKLAVLTFIAAAAMPCAYAADVEAVATLTRGTIISPSDIQISATNPVEKAEIAARFVGKEMRRTVYAGYALNSSLVGEPVLIRRNSQVNMVFKMGRMRISASGRALGQGAEGDTISVMNLESRKRVQGVVLADGTIEVTR